MPLHTELPAVSAADMRRIDELAESTYHIRLIQMMENAGRSLARWVRDHVLGGSAAGGKVLVLAGPGGNGGGGLVAARRLTAWGAEVHLALAAKPNQLAPVSRHQFDATRAMAIHGVDPTGPWPQIEVIVDALLGYSLVGAPRPPIDEMIQLANRSGSPIVALDLPSGLHPDNGIPTVPTIQALATVTLALPKTGLLFESAAPYVGDLWLADLGLPAELYSEAGLTVPSDLFAEDDLIQLTRPSGRISP